MTNHGVDSSFSVVPIEDFEDHLRRTRSAQAAELLERAQQKWSSLPRRTKNWINEFVDGVWEKLDECRPRHVTPSEGRRYGAGEEPHRDQEREARNSELLKEAWEYLKQQVRRRLQWAWNLFYSCRWSGNQLASFLYNAFHHASLLSASLSGFGRAVPGARSNPWLYWWWVKRFLQGWDIGGDNPAGGPPYVTDNPSDMPPGAPGGFRAPFDPDYEGDPADRPWFEPDFRNPDEILPHRPPAGAPYPPQPLPLKPASPWSIPPNILLGHGRPQ